MTTKVEIVGDRVLKSLDSDGAVDRLLLWTELLRNAGVTTPLASRGDRPRQVAFARISGRSGLEAVLTDGDAAIRNIFAALASLHAAEASDLPVFDALVRIRPRLDKFREPWIENWIDEYLPPPDSTGLIHGDFHAGQLIQDDEGVVWILDLDDLAHGSREADLGNFAAHLATRPETRSDDLFTGFRRWLERILRLNSGADSSLVYRYGRIALLRRALKLAEKGDRRVLCEIRNA